MAIEELCVIMKDHDTIAVIGNGIVYLALEGYLKIEARSDGSPTVKITEKGISAYMGAYFLEKNQELIYKRIIDWLMIICNGVVAMVAIMALNSTNQDNQLKSIEERLNKIEQEYKTTKYQPILPSLDSLLNDYIKNADSSKKK